MLLQSHDHYRHLEGGSELARRHPEAIWCAPRGVARLPHALAAHYVVVECDWREASVACRAEPTCWPAPHFPVRTILSRDTKLW